MEISSDSSQLSLNWLSREEASAMKSNLYLISISLIPSSLISLLVGIVEAVFTNSQELVSLVSRQILELC
jgi:hypothetical protein